MKQEIPVACSWGHLKAAAAILSTGMALEDLVVSTFLDSLSYLSNDLAVYIPNVLCD